MKALVVRFSAIGDCVMAVPCAVAIRRAEPTARIVWAVEPWCEPVIDAKRLVDSVALFPRDEWKRKPWSPATWRDQIRRYLALRRERFDIGIDLQGHSKTAICLRIAMPRRRISVPGTDAMARRLNPQAPEAPPGTHIVERNLGTLRLLGDFGSPPEWIMPELIEERATVQAMLPPTRPLATLAVSAGWRKKDYPAPKWSEVAAALLNKGWSVAFVGGPEDRAPQVEGVVDLTGKLTLAESMAAIASSDVHCSADTGPGHIAAAYGVPIVSVFGATDPAVYRPYTDRGVVLECKGDPSGVSPSEIAEAAQALLGVRRAAFPH